MSYLTLSILLVSLFTVLLYNLVVEALREEYSIFLRRELIKLGSSVFTTSYRFLSGEVYPIYYI